MELFLENFLAFPVVIFSGMLVIVALYWLVAAFGLLEIDVLDMDAPEAGDIGGEVGDDISGEGLAGILLKLGLDGIPLTLVVTLVTLFGWLVSYFGVHLFLRFLEGGAQRALLGGGLFLAALTVGVLLTAIAARPLRPLFRRHDGSSSAHALKGKRVTVRSSTVTPDRGEGLFEEGGVSLILQVRTLAGAPSLSRGEKGVILHYHPDTHTYTVSAESGAPLS